MGSQSGKLGRYILSLGGMYGNRSLSCLAPQAMKTQQQHMLARDLAGFGKGAGKRQSSPLSCLPGTCNINDKK